VLFAPIATKVAYRQHAYVGMHTFVGSLHSARGSAPDHERGGSPAIPGRGWAEQW